MSTKLWLAPYRFGQGIAAGSTVKAGLKSALVFLGQRSNERLNGFRKTYHVHRTFCIDGGEFKKGLKQIQSALVSTLCCDEKLFRFTGKGRIVRKVPNKPARVGIWHYQAVVTLPGELPYLVYTEDTTPQPTWGRGLQHQ